MGALIDLILSLLLVAMILSQVIVPSLTGKALFPAFHKKLRTLEKQRDEILMERQVQETAKEIDELKKSINPTEGNSSDK